MAYQINDYYFNEKYKNAHQDDILHCDSNVLSYNGELKAINDSYTLLPGSSIDITRINVASMSDPAIMKSSPEVIFYLYDRLLWIKNYLYLTNPELQNPDIKNHTDMNFDPYKKWFKYILELVYKVSLTQDEKESLIDFINTYTTLAKYHECLRQELDTFYDKAKVLIERIKSESTNGNYFEGYNLIFNKVFNEAKENDGNSQSNSYQRSLTNGNNQTHKPIPIPLPPAPDEERITNNAAYIDLFVIIFLILATIVGVVTFIIA